ncbi:MAG: helix-turn-helix domain-containing protein [Muribaculaceae bacterium]
MEAKNNIVEDYTPVLEQNFGKVGSAEWEKSIEEAEAFYTGQIIKETRREAKMTQSELAAKLNVTKSYISRIENGFINPSVTVFYRIISALGMRVEIVKPIY